MNINNKDEPNTAPKPDRWYNLTLGSSFKEPPSSKFCTLRYEFKPASIDKNQPGKLHKNKDNRVSVEFQNSQPGKPKVSFEGSSEDYKENDAVLFFDGETFRLERLHRAVKRLKHVRLPGESAAASASASTFVSATAETSSPPVVKAPTFQSQNNVARALPVEVERIEVGEIKSSDTRPKNGKAADYPSSHANQSNAASPEAKSDDLDEELDILNDDIEGNTGGGDIIVKEIDTGIDINIPHHQNDTDDEIADVDAASDDDDKGRNAAEELRAQVNAQEQQRTSSSSSSSGSESSGSSSSSSSSSSSRSDSSSNDKESSDAETVNSI